MNIQTFQDTDQWVTAAVAEITKDIPQDRAFSLALSGGTTPAPVYEALAQQSLPWEQGHIFQVDERFVAPDKSESNSLLILQHFVMHLPTAAGKVYLYQTGGKTTWEESAAQYDQMLREYGKNLDVCVLGIGHDGHIASLFPQEPALHETEKLATISETNQFPVWKRMTMTFPIILRSKKIVVLLKGAEKQVVIEELLHGNKSWEEFPAKRLLEHGNVEVVFLEK